MVFKTDYYLHIFSPRLGYKFGISVAVATAFLIEGARFSLLVASASDTINGNTKGLWLGIIASIVVTIYDIVICVELGNVWGSVVHTHIFQVMVVLGLMIEIRLCLMVSPTHSSTPQNGQHNVFGLGKFRHTFLNKNQQPIT